MPIIVGVPRSGTTLLRFMLDGHPEMAIPPETGFLVLTSQLASQDRTLRERFFEGVTGYPPEAPMWRDSVAERYRAFYRLYARRCGKPRYAH